MSDDSVDSGSLGPVMLEDDGFLVVAALVIGSERAPRTNLSLESTDFENFSEKRF